MNTPEDVIKIAKISQYLSQNEIENKGLYGGGTDLLLPRKIYNIRKTVEWTNENAVSQASATGYITIDTINSGPGDVTITVFVNDPTLGNISLGSAAATSGMTTSAIATAVYNGIKNNPYEYYVPAPTSNVITVIAPLSKGSSINGNNNLSCTSYNQVNDSFIVGAGFNSSVTALAVQADGNILVGGFFTTYKGVSANCMIRLLPNGSKDTSFSFGTGVTGGVIDNYVSSIAVQSDGRVLFVGYFDEYNGVYAPKIFRTQSEGSLDTSLQIPYGGFDLEPLSIAIQSDGKILLVGNFTSLGGVSANYIIRLNSDGSRDTSFAIGTGFNSSAISIAIQSDGKILIGGDFTTYKGASANYIIRLNSDGSRDTSFVVGTGFNIEVSAMSLKTNKIYIGGAFTAFQGWSSPYIISLNQ